METSASQIVNYRGNAASALGSSEGASSGANTVYGDTSATRVNEVMDDVFRANAVKQNMLFQQQIKDRDATYAMIASGKLNTGKMLPQDRDRINKEFLDPVKKMMLADPNFRSNPKKFIEVQQAQEKFDEAKMYGQGRFAMITKLDSQIAAETDPEKRARMQQHREKTLKQDLYDEVLPYQQLLDFSDKIHVQVKAVDTKSQGISGDQLVTTTRSHTPVADFVKGSINMYIDSPNQTIKNQIDLYRDQVRELPDEQQARLGEQWNSVIKKAMDDENIKEGDINYIAPISVKTDPQTGKVFINESPERINLAASLLKFYKNETKTEGLVSKLPSDILKNQAAYKKAMTEINTLIPAKVATEYARRNKLMADTDKARREIAKLDDGVKQTEETADYYINTLTELFDPKKFKEAVNLKDDPKFKNTNLQGEVLAGRGTDGGRFSLLNDAQMKALGRPSLGGKSGSTKTIQMPDYIVRNVDDPNNPYFISSFYPTDDDGKTLWGEKPESIRSNPQGLIQPLVKGVVGASAGADKVIANITNRYKKRTGSGNINSTIMQLAGSDYDFKDMPQADPVAPAQAATPAKKTAPVKPLADSTVNKLKAYLAKKKK